MDFVQKARDDVHVSTDDQTPAIDIVTKALSDIVERLNSPVFEGKTTSARDFIRALEVSFNARMHRDQQDAQELLQLVMQKVDEEANSRNKDEAVDHQGSARLLPVHGRLASQIECTYCHYRPSMTVSDFLVLSLNVPQQGKTSLDECFDGLLKQELIEDYVCARCKLQSVVTQKQRQLGRTTGEAKEALSDDIRDLTEALENDLEQRASDPLLSSHYQIPRRTITKHASISQFPEILMLHLSRSVFGAYSSKNTAKVDFSEQLRLGSFDGYDYRLQSVVTHRGGHNSGHYETFKRQELEDEPCAGSGLAKGQIDSEQAQKQRRKHKKVDKWWGISDDKVRECRTRDVLGLQRECYLLFYEKLRSASR